MTFNPYHQWLGLDPQLKNPHHFQLLGVSSKVDDPVEYQRQVHEATKSRLELLGQIEPGQHSKLLEQLKKKILFAQSVLADEQKRNDYVKKLKAQIKSAQSEPASSSQQFKKKEAETVKEPSDFGPAPVRIKPSSSSNPIAPTAKPAAVPPRASDLLPPGVALPASDLLPPRVSLPADATTPSTLKVAIGPNESGAPAAVPLDMPRQGNPTPPIDPATTPAVTQPQLDPAVQPASPTPVARPAIPMAIPITGTAPVATASPTSGAVAVNADGVPINEVKISKVKRERKRSLAGPAILGLMILAGIAGAISIYLNWDTVLRLGGIDPDAVPSSPGIIKDDPAPKPPIVTNDSDQAANSDTSDTNQTEKSESTELAKIDLDSLPELDVDEVMQHPATSEMTHRSPEQEQSYAEQIKNQLASAGEADPLATTSANAPDADLKTENTPDRSAESNRKTLKLSPNQLAELRIRMERARRSLIRRDKATAVREIEKSQALFDSLLGAEFVVDPEQKPLQDLVTATAEATEFLDGFWKQVVNSCLGIPGGQEITVAQQIVGFVEATESQVIVRNAGSNITYDYEFLPPGLAMELAKQGAIPDVPTWRLQQAVFYALYTDQNPTYAAKAEELISLSESDGHDVAHLRRFLAFDLQAADPGEQVNMPSQQVMTDALAEFHEVHQYSDPEKLDWERAAQLAAILLDENPDSVQSRLAYLDQARLLAIRGRDAHLVEDAVLEQGKLANFNSADWLSDAFNELAKQKLDSQQSRRLMETAIPFLISDGSSRANPKRTAQLIDRLKKIAEKEGFVDSLRRLNQIN